VSGSGGGAGNGGNVSVTDSGGVAVLGTGAYGIFAQSIGGGGGIAGGGSNGLAFIGSDGGAGSGGAITIEQSGSILAYSPSSVAIFAQSAGGSGSGPITIDTSGVIANFGGASAAAIVTDTTSTTTIDSTGVIIGNVIANGGGTVAFTNEQNALFAPGNTVMLGVNGTLTNAGVLAPGGVGTVQTTALTGNYAQTATGALDVDVHVGGASDLLNVSGSANLSGEIVPNVLSLSPSSAPITVLTAGGGVSDSSLSVVQSPFFSWGLDVSSNAVAISLDGVHYAFPQLSGNQNAIGSHFENAWASGNLGGLGPLMTYLSTLDPGTTYAQALDRLSPGSYLASATPLMLTQVDFTNSLFSCYRPVGEHYEGAEMPCTWSRALGQSDQQAYSSTTLGFTGSSQGIEGGQQRALGGGRFVDTAIGYTHSSVAIDGNASTQTNGANAGIAWKQQFGATTFAQGISAGYAWLSTLRAPLPGIAASSQSGSLDLDARAGISHVSDRGDFYLKPYANVDVLFVDRPPVSETNAGAVGLNMASMNKVLGIATPGIEIGGTFHQGDTTFRPYLNASISAFTSDHWSIASTFQGSPSGVAPFAINSSFPGVLYRAYGGLQLSQKRLILTLDYGLSLGSGYSSQTGSFKFDYKI
ncbi:MAG: autotransporter domain-containing protein, partial [Candidatus Aquilonibacter sp.]